MDNRRVSIDHYENFPVASILCPPALRPAVRAIYRFARTADDLADEGEAAPQERLADLAAYRADLVAISTDAVPSGRWQPVFRSLQTAIEAHRLPIRLLSDLLSAFEQDVVQHRYTDRAALLDYCARSANPVGRLLLHLYGVTEPSALSRSDAICSALQLTNFWQDLGVDTRRGRLYVPQSDLVRRRVGPETLLQGEDSASSRLLVADMVVWTRELMRSGAPLVHAVPGRAGWELRLVVQGGLRILDKVQAMAFGTLMRRPRLRWFDFPVIVWRALWMRPPVDGAAVAGRAA